MGGVGVPLMIPSPRMKRTRKWAKLPRLEKDLSRVKGRMTPPVRRPTNGAAENEASSRAGWR